MVVLKLIEAKSRNQNFLTTWSPVALSAVSFLRYFKICDEHAWVMLRTLLMFSVCRSGQPLATELTHLVVREWQPNTFSFLSLGRKEWNYRNIKSKTINAKRKKKIQNMFEIVSIFFFLNRLDLTHQKVCKHW